MKQSKATKNKAATTTKKVVVLVNLGTPSSLKLKDIRGYLKQFLSDPRVITAPALVRWLLVRCIILPFRSPKTQANYRKIWMKEGSPLLVYSKGLQKKVQEHLGKSWRVELAMRYGQPSLEKIISKLAAQGVEQIHFVPLYPQYASATTGSINEEVFRILSSQRHVPAITVHRPFFHQEYFLRSIYEIGRPYLSKGYDHVLFSFHGLPESHLTDGENGSTYCLQAKNCCESMSAKNSFCYRAHCVQTAHALAKMFGLKPAEYTICFQSRLGRARWTQPALDETVEELAEKGVQRLVVFSPSFVADCIETLEELGLEEKENFLAAGGKRFSLVPCVNLHPTWTKGLASDIIICNTG